jgi:alpha-beta hydrolase superfamily lysophospholipase
MALSAWARAFSAPGLLEVLAPASRSTAEGLAAECLYGSAAGGLSARAAGVELGAAPPWHAEPWRRILFEATPGGAPIHVPVLLVQGGADKVVPPRLTRALERSLCSLGEIVELRVYPTAEHAEAGTVASPDVAAWLSQRFAGAAAPSSCAAA